MEFLQNKYIEKEKFDKKNKDKILLKSIVLSKEQ